MTQYSHDSVKPFLYPYLNIHIAYMQGLLSQANYDKKVGRLCLRNGRYYHCKQAIFQLYDETPGYRTNLQVIIRMFLYRLESRSGSTARRDIVLGVIKSFNQTRDGFGPRISPGQLKLQRSDSSLLPIADPTLHCKIATQFRILCPFHVR